MRKLFLALIGVGMLAGLVYAETSFDTASVTQTSQYVYFRTPRSAVTICNAAASANVLYFRLFNTLDTPAVATTANSSVAVGACVSFSKAPTQPGYFAAMALVCDTAATATVNVYSE